MLHKLLLTPFKYLSPLKRVGYSLIFAIGVGIAVLFIATSFLVNVNSLAILLASIGAALGALIIGLMLPKFLVSKESEREKQLNQKMKQVLAEQARTSAELERVKAQQLQLQNVQNALKLTLLEVETSITDFKTDELGPRETSLGGKTHSSYVGVLRKKATVLLGLDLANLRVQQQGDELLIDNLRAQYQGTRETQDEWLFRQVQTQEDNLILPNRLVVNNDDSRLSEACDKHRQDLEERVRNGVEMQAFDHSVEKLGLQWLTLLFAPMGLHVRLHSLDEQSQYFLEYLKSKQLELSQNQQGLENQNRTLLPPDEQ